MSCRSKAVTAHTAVIGFLIRGLPIRGHTYNHIARLYMRIIYHIAAFHTTGYGTIYNNGPHKVSDIGCLPAGRIHADTHIA